MTGSRARRLVWGLVYLLIPLWGAPAIADEFGVQNQDYFSRDPAVKNLVRAVEAYHLNQGMDSQGSGDFDMALQHFEFILRYFPNHPRVLVLTGDLTLQMKRPEVGDEYFRRAIALFPETVGAAGYRNYGKFLFRAGRTTDAIGALKRSLVKDDTFSETHYYLGLAYLDKENFPLANHHAQRAYERGFPLLELKNKLIEVGAWAPEPAPPSVPARRKAPGKRAAENARQ